MLIVNPHPQWEMKQATFGGGDIGVADYAITPKNPANYAMKRIFRQYGSDTKRNSLDCAKQQRNRPNLIEI